MSRPGMLLGLLALLAVTPGPARAWWNEEWTGRKPIRIDTTAAGGAIAEPIGTAPVLVRLHAGNFRFDAAREDGADLRFVAGDDKTPLKFHLEKYDGLLGEALAWVSVPDLKPGTKTELWLYYGNPKAAAAEDAKGTYDAATALVYHFAEKGQPQRDATSWANHASGPGLPSEGALIGRGLRLDGASTLAIPGGPALAWAAGGRMTWSCWVKPTDGAASGVIFSRRDGQRVFRVGLDAGRPFVEVQDGGEPQRVTGPAPLPGLSWHHLAVVAADGLTLVVDGAPAGMVAARLPALDTASTLGGDPGAPEEPARPRGVLKGRSPAAAVPAATPAGFKGEFDELQIAKVDRPAGFLMLAAVSQGTEPGKLVAAGQDEQGSSAGGGYFAVILRSVTLDGWVIIGILGVMSLLSVVVMVGKAGYLSAVERANDKFTERFRAHAGDLPELVAARPEKSPLGEEKVLRQSSLFRLFQIAASQIRARSDGHQALHAEAIESIRASMDAGLVRENQRLAKQMVLLTIAISGGPFLGLLGTVMGVMITFAAIAAAGDVNVNAIAPGIAAALVATVAGLAVAIPALFGYNWLLTRNKDVTANMVVFADEMVTKVAEEYSERAVSERVTRSAIHLAPPASAS